MAMQFSVSARNDRLDALFANIGPGAILKIRSGTLPANCAASDSGVALAVLNLPTTYMLAASGGSKAKTGTWQDLTADASGTAVYFRVYANDGVTCGIQGTVSLTGGGGDMIIDSVSINIGQSVTVIAFTITDGNV
jgi:hypothetical protein